MIKNLKRKIKKKIDFFPQLIKGVQKMNSDTPFFIDKILFTSKLTSIYIIEKIVFHKLGKTKNIKKGTLLKTTCNLYSMAHDIRHGTFDRVVFKKNNFIIPLKIEILSTESPESFPDISIWTVVLYNGSLYYVDMFEFINYAKYGYITDIIDDEPKN